MRPLFFALYILQKTGYQDCDSFSFFSILFLSKEFFPPIRWKVHLKDVYHLEFCKTSFGIVHRLEFSKLNLRQEHEEIIWTLRTSRNSLLIDHRLPVSISCRFRSSNGLDILTHEFLQIKSKREISVAPRDDFCLSLGWFLYPDLIPYCYMWNVVLLQLQDWIILLDQKQM